MKRRGPFMFVRIALFAVVAATVLGFVVRGLWNWLMPVLFGLHSISFWQALGLLILSKILLGGFHRHSWHRSQWRERMREHWGHMSPEERARFRQGMWNCGFTREHAAADSNQ